MTVTSTETGVPDVDVGRAAIAAAAVAVGVAGCAAPPAALGNRSATVTINGKTTGPAHPVECSQAGWTWLIDSPGEKSGFSAAVQSGATMTANSVQIRDLGGFTGSFWEGTVGDAEASVNGGMFTITGTAHGFFADNPTGEANATFEITTAC
ncbi:MAG: lipoprotein LpqH [Actinobacteria bacterium]|nr:lipoprotein LpqH [Actinomycetota bacterium]